MFRLTQEQLEESSFYQMILEKGTEVGRVEGLEVGLVEGTRRAVRLVAGLRFPALGNLPESGALFLLHPSAPSYKGKSG